MGWASGSEIYDTVIEAARTAIPDLGARIRFHKTVISAFEVADWDTTEECLGQDVAYDQALHDLHSDWEAWSDDE